MKKLILLSFIVWLSGQHSVYAAFTHDPDLNWRTLESENFIIHFHNGEEALIPKVTRIAEKAHTKVTEFFDWIPNSRTHIILTDRMDFSNAFAMPIPRNTMFIIVTPPGDSETISDYHDWLELVITHEYVHIVHVDKANGLPMGARNLFGRIAFFFPNALQPLWVLEGIASYLETQIEPGIGRGTNSAFRNLMRLEVESGVKPISQVNLPMVSWPAGTTRYLYGVYFFNFLRDTYGEDKIKAWVNNYGDNLIPFKINSNSKDIFKKDMTQLWAEFTDYLMKQFNPEIEKLKQSGLVEGKQMTRHGYLTGSPRSINTGDVFYIKNDWLEQPELMQIPAGTQQAEAIAKIYDGSFDVHPDAGVLITQIDNYKNVNYFSDLYQINIQTGKKTQLTDGQRYTSAVWSPDAKNIAAIHVEKGGSSLHLLDDRGTFIKTLWESTNYEMVSGMDWHPVENKIVASIWRPGTRWNLEIFDLDSLQWKPLTSTDKTEAQPQFTADGKSIIFSADYGVANNIYRLELESGQVTQLTNVLGGTLSATALPDDSGYFYAGQHNTGSDIYFLPSTEATNKRFTPEVLADKKTEAQSADAPSSITDVAKSSTDITESSSYQATKYIMPVAWFPFAAVTEDTSVLGISTYGADPLNWHQYNALLAIDTDNQWALGSILYIYDRWRTTFKLYALHDITIVRDNQDNLNSFRNSDEATFEAVYPFFKRDYQWSLHAGVSTDRESDREVEPGGIALPDMTDDLVGVAVTFNSARFFPRGISLQDGYKWRIVAEDSDTLESDYSGQVYTLDWRGYFGMPASHVIATRLVSATSTDMPRPFRLGGLSDGIYIAEPGATIAEPTPLVFNKRKYALRGYKEGLPQLRGDHMNLAEIEWRFPVSLVERTAMTPPFGVTKVHGKVFYSAGDAWFDDTESADYYQSAGMEISANVYFGYFIPFNVKAGFAKGLDDELGEEEFYLQLGISF